MKTLLLRAGLFLLCAMCTLQVNAEAPSMEKLSISESIVMFYYKDISKISGFYEDTLGLKATLVDDWVRIYRITPTSSVGIVQEGPGGFHKANSDGDSAVMLSIVSTDVDAWYDRLKTVGDITFESEISNHESAPIRAFLVRDPGGYTIEFFQWLNK